MRSSGLFLACALILAVQFVSVHTEDADPFIGKWITPFVQDDSDTVCCVPKAVTLTKTAYGYQADYEFASSIFEKGFSAKCSSLFSFSGRGTLQLVSKGNGIYQGGKPYLTGFQSAYFNFQLTNDKSLSIAYPPSSSAYNYYGCRFTMSGKAPSEVSGGLVFLLIVIAGVGFCVFKNHQRKQLNLLAQQNAAARDAVDPQPNPIDGYQFNAAAQTNVYVAPNMHVAFNPNQQFVQQQGFVQQNQAFPQQNQGFVQQNQAFPQQNQALPQQNQAFPQQNQALPQQNQALPQQNQAFPQAQPNAQMNVGFGANGQVNMAVNVNGGEPARF